MMFGDHYHYYSLHGISDGIIDRLGQENYLFRKMLRHHHLVRKAASGSVEENATLRV
jgi:hypothetical protein